MIRDNICRKYIFFSVIDLALMPRKRVNRPIHKNRPERKGKWLLNLRNGCESQSLDEAMSHIHCYLQALSNSLFESLECYGNYVDEDIAEGGIVRNPSHWETDVRSTR